MNEYTSAVTAANGALCSALIDLLLDKGVIDREDAMKIVKSAMTKAGPFIRDEPYGSRISSYFMDIIERFAKRKS